MRRIASAVRRVGEREVHLSQQDPGRLEAEFEPPGLQRSAKEEAGAEEIRTSESVICTMTSTFRGVKKRFRCPAPVDFTP